MGCLTWAARDATTGCLTWATGDAAWHINIASSSMWALDTWECTQTWERTQSRKGQDAHRPACMLAWGCLTCCRLCRDRLPDMAKVMHSCLAQQCQLCTCSPPAAMAMNAAGCTHSPRSLCNVMGSRASSSCMRVQCAAWSLRLHPLQVDFHDPAVSMQHVDTSCSNVWTPGCRVLARAEPTAAVGPGVRAAHEQPALPSGGA